MARKPTSKSTSKSEATSRPKAGAKRARGGRKRRAAPEDVRRHIIDTALTLAATRRWSDIALADIADAAGLSIFELYGHFRSKAAIANAFWRSVDEAVLAGGPGDTDDTARDRLFDVLMRRFDVLQAHRDAVTSLVWDLAGDPGAAVGAGLRLGRSMAWMLEIEGISTAGPEGCLRVKGLSLVYLSAFRVWLKDDTEDMAHTMAALDASLRRADQVYGTFRRLLRRPGSGEAGPEPA